MLSELLTEEMIHYRINQKLARSNHICRTAAIIRK